MALGPNLKWIKNEKKILDFLQFIIFFICLIISYLIIFKAGTNFLFSTLLLSFSFYLFFHVIKSFFQKNSSYSQKISHFGFSLFLISILFNGILSKENSGNMKVGDEMNFLNKKIIFENVQIKDGSNYRTLIGEFKLKDKKNTFEFNPEIRVYSQPETITSEADILSTIFSDNFLVFSLIKDDGYFNVRYQFKPLMIWIWLSVLIMSLGGLLSLIKKNEK